MIKLAWGTSFRRAFKRYTRNNLARQKRVFQTLDELARDLCNRPKPLRGQLIDQG